jgi:hypothetical protein
MSKTEQIRTIREAYSRLVGLNLQDGWTDVARKLLDMNVQSERGHRKYRPSSLAGNPWHMSVKDAGKLFVCQHLLDAYRRFPDGYTVNDITSIRNEVLYAQAWANRFRDQLSDWFAVWDVRVSPIDYAKLMNPESDTDKLYKQLHSAGQKTGEQTRVV